MKQPLFTGVCTALVTPFLDNRINYPLLDQLVQRQLDAGVGAIVLSGTTGEAPTLSDTEKQEMIKRTKAFVGDACTVIAGSGTNSTEHAIEMSLAAQEAGADALLVVTPYYNKGNANGLFRHYYSIAAAVDIPIIIYNVPTRTGVDIPISVCRQLSEIHNIIGIKEASSDITKLMKIRAACPDDFYIWSGNDDQIVPAMSVGAKGVISVVSNIFPELTAAMTHAALDGDFDTASALQCQLLPYINALFSEVNPIPVKYAMRYAGYDCGACRLPLGTLSEDSKQRIDKLFKDIL